MLFFSCIHSICTWQCRGSCVAEH